MSKVRTRYVLNSKNVWIGRYHVEGQRAKEVTLISDKDLQTLAKTASQRTAKLEELYLAKNPANDTPAPAVVISQFQSDVADYLAHIELEKTPKTLRMYRHVLNQLQSMEQLEMVRQGWIKKKLSPATINSNLRTVRAFERWRVERENNQRISQGQPLLGVRKFQMVDEPKKTIASFTDDHLDDILQAIEGRILVPPPCVNKHHEQRWELLRRAYYLLRYSGLRGSEVNSLRWADLDLQEGFIHINDHKTARGDDFDVKGDHHEWSPIVYDELLNELRSWSQDHEFVLRGYWASATELMRAFKKIEQDLGISGIKPLHGYRAAYTCGLFKLGASTEYVRRALRHVNASTTQRYLDSRNDGMADHLRELARNRKGAA